MTLPPPRKKTRSIRERDKALRAQQHPEQKPGVGHVLKLDWIDCRQDRDEVREILNRNKKS